MIWYLIQEYTKIQKKKNILIHIFSPKKDIEMRILVMELDFASLYSSFIITYNFSPDKIILMHKKADIA